MKEVFTAMDPKEIKKKDLRGIYREIADLLGTDAAFIMHEAFRGQEVTFPVSLFTSTYIAERIVSEYGEKSVKQLATKYGYSEKWIRTILKKAQAKKKS